MKKHFIGVALAVCISTTAFAEEKKNIIPKLDLSFDTDSTYNTTKETKDTEFGMKGLRFSLLPTYSWDNEEITDIEVGLGYKVKVSNNISVVPYGEMHFNNDLEETDKIIGLRTRLKF